MKVTVYSTRDHDKEYLTRFNDGSHDLQFLDLPLTKSSASLCKGSDAVCLFVNDLANEDVIRELRSNGIGLIALRCAGFNNIDLQAAARHDIKVARVPAYSPEAVAEHAVALILTLNRKTHKAYCRVREGNFSLERLTGFNLSGKTVGVIGTGKIGECFINIMKGFGTHVIAFDPVKSDTVLSKGVRYVELKELLQTSDIISLHCPLTTQTKHLFNKDAFAQMKTGAMLINTSRGAVIDTNEAIAALKSRKLGYLGIDVYEQEENLFFNDLSEKLIEDETILRLMSFPNVLVTAHQGFFTVEALTQIAVTTLNNISAFEKGEKLVNEIRS